MRYVCQRVSAFAGALFLLSSFCVHGQSSTGLTITNYQFVSEQRWSRTESYVTYKADLVNTGPARDALTATVSSTASGVQTVPGQRNLHFAPVPSGGTVTSSNTFTIFVNRTLPFDFSSLHWSFVAPYANAGPDQTASVGSRVTLNGSASTNPSGIGTLSYHWAFVSQPSGNARLENADSVIASFVVDVRGSYVVSLTVSNGVESDTAFVNINTGNSPPVADAGPNQTLLLGSTAHLNGSRSFDPDGDPLTYSWTLIAMPPGSSAVLSSTNSVTSSFVLDKAGTYVVNLVVSDGKASSGAATVQITTGNTPPVADAGPNRVVTVGSVIQLNGSGSTDVDGDALTYQWSFNSKPANSTAQLSDPKDVKPSFTADVVGTYVVQLIVNDGRASSEPATTTITTDTIQAPVADAGKSQTVQHGALVALSGSATDPQGLPLTLSWSLEAKPPGSTAVLMNADSARPTFVADVPGPYVAQLIAYNGFLHSTPSTVTITTTNAAPQADAGPDQTVAVGATVQLDGRNSSDADRDALSYSWSLLKRPDGSAAALSAATSSTPTFVADVSGTYVAQLIVSDPFTKSDPKTVTITAGVHTITLKPNPLNLAINSSGMLEITLGEAAGASDIILKLASSDPTIVTVPATATVPAGSATTSIKVDSHSAGSAFILATGTGLSPGTANVNVSTAGISVAFDRPTVGLGATLHGTITLSVPAAVGGTVVTLSASPAGIVDFPLSVTVASGTKADFNITGLAVGSATLTANAAGFTSGSASISVSKRGAIKLPVNMTVGPGQSVPYNISLVTPAPVGGVTVALASSDSSTASIQGSVFIPEGKTEPLTQPLVNGLKFGSVTITATAQGFDGDAQTVTVTAKLSFSPTLLTVGVNGSGNLTLMLSSPAPAGLTITLSSDNTKVATVVSPSLPFPAGSTSVVVNVNGLTAGSTLIHASAPPFLAEVTATVSVALLGRIQLPSGLSVGQGETVPFPVTLTTGAPAGGTQVTLTVADSSKATIFPLQVKIPAGKTVPDAQPQITGVALGGTIVSASAPAYSSDSQTVNVVSAINITTPSLPNGVANSPYTATLAATGGKIPYTWSATGLPAGLSMNAATGAITGSTAATGAVTVTVSVKDSSTPTQLSSSKNFLLTIVPQIAITTASLNLGVVGSAYSVKLAASGGTSPFTWSASGLPPGLTLNTSTGEISGTPTVAGTSTVGITVTDSTSPTHLTTSKTLTLVTVNPLAISTTTLGTAISGTAYSLTLAATGGTTPYTWGATGLPAGLTLNASTGAISGTPTAVGASTVAVTVTDSTSSPHLTATKSLILTVISPPPILPATLPTGVVGVPYNVTLSMTGGVAPFTWSASGLPAGLTLNASTGVISGTPTVAGTSSAVVTVTDSTTPTHLTATRTITFVVVTQPTIITATLQDGVVGGVYTATLAATGGTAPFTWAATGLPAGLTLTSTTGVIIGTPTAAGTSSVAITVTDSTTPTKLSATKTLTLKIGPGLSISVPALPDAVVGVPISITPSASGGTPPYTWSATGAPWISVNASTGVLSGTPTSAGPVSIVLTVMDSTSPSHVSTSKTLSLTVAPAVSITTTSLSNGVTGSAYAQTVVAAGGKPPYKWSAAGLPAGLTINASTGVISGTTSSSGSHSVTITVADSSSPSASSASKTLTLLIVAPPTITTASLPGGSVNSPYAANLDATGGTPPYTWEATGLPPGLSINPSSGVISGTVTSATTNSVVVKVTDSTSPSKLSATKSFSLAIAGILSITTPSLPVGIAGTAYNATMTASGGTPPYKWSATGLPAGMTINASTGAISGLAGSAGSTPVSIMVTDSNTPTARTATANLTLQLVDPLSVSTTSLPPAVAGTPYSFTAVASGGLPPYSWSAGGLPPGLSMDIKTGVISGTPSASGANSVTIAVADSMSPTHLTATKTLSLQVVQPLSITTASLPGGVTGAAYSFGMSATGGTAPYTWSASGLPGGLTLNPSTGVISGSPTAAATSSVTFTITDSTSTKLTANRTLSLTVLAPVVISTAALPNGATGAAYSATLAATGGTPTYTWGATGLPTGLTLNTATGAISGTPSVAGTFTVNVTATDSTSPTKLSGTKQFSLLIIKAPQITTTSLPGGVVGTAYSQTATATDGTPPYTWGAVGLPAGLTISGSGAITGTPTTAGTSTVTLTLTDSSSPTKLNATKNLSITILAPVTITTVSLPPGITGTSYGITLTATGGTPSYKWSATGLPAGLTLNTTTGAITGTPTATGTFQVNVTATDSTSPTNLAGSKTFTLAVVAPLTVTTSSLTGGVVGTAYSLTAAASGGTTPYTWSATGLPANLAISPAGVISGTPAAAGTSTVTLSVSDSTNPKLTASKVLSLIVIAPPEITTSSPLPTAVTGTSYATTIAGKGGTPTYTWAATGLPANLTMNATTGVISGTPSATGTSTITVTLTDSTSPTNLKATKTFTLAVVAPVTITTASPLPGGVTGTAYSATVAASGGTPSYTWAATNLPTGLSINAATGEISGTPTVAGSKTVTVSVTDSTSPTKLSATKTLTINVVTPPSITTASPLPAGVTGASYGVTLAATGGTAPYKPWSATGLPAGLTLNADTGAINGVPTTTGKYTVNVTVKDATTPQLSATKSFAMSVVAPLTITTSSLQNGSVGVSYAVTLTGTGGTTAYKWSANGLPPGLTLNGTTGVISGTPTAQGTSSVTVILTDSTLPVNLSVSKALTLTVAIAPAVLVVDSATVGQDLQAGINITIPSPAGPGGVPVTVTTADATKVLLGGKTSANLTIPENQTQTSVFAQGLAKSGSVVITATSPGYADGKGTITLAPSGFVLEGPNGIGVSFPINATQSTIMTIYPALLDSAGKFIEKQQMRGSLPVPVSVTVNSTSAGSVGSPVSFTPGALNATTTFTAGGQAGTATISVPTPTGYSAVTDGSNSVVATINPVGLTCSTNVSVGRNLEAPMSCSLGGFVGGSGATFTITSNDETRLKFSTSDKTAGSKSISINMPSGSRGTPLFYVQALDGSGTVGFTADVTGIGSTTGSIALNPSGIVFANASTCGTASPILAGVSGNPATVTVFSARLSPAGACLENQAIAGGLSAQVTISSSNTSIGTISPAQVAIGGGLFGASTSFVPGATKGTATLSVSVPASPAGFSTPSLAYRTLAATVTDSRIILTADQTPIGKDLQLEGAVTIGQAIATNLDVTVTSGASGLVVAKSATDVGGNSVVVTIPAGKTTAPVFLQAVGNTGTVTYSAHATGYIDGTATIVLTNSGVVLSDANDIPMASVTAGGTNTIKVALAQLEPGTDKYSSTQMLRGGVSLNVTINSSAPGVLTIDSPVAISAGQTGNTTLVHGKLAGTASITAVQPTGFVAAKNTLFPDFKPMPTINVTVN